MSHQGPNINDLADSIKEIQQTLTKLTQNNNPRNSFQGFQGVHGIILTFNVITVKLRAIYAKIAQRTKSKHEMNRIHNKMKPLPKKVV